MCSSDLSSADLVSRSKVAETNAKAKSITQDAANREQARISEINSEIEIARTQTERRIVETLSRREALIAEEVGRVRAAVAKAEGELKVQTARVEQVRLQLEADVIAPARAETEAAESAAKGGAAKIIEDGRATNTVLAQMIETWKTGGDAARDVFLLQKLQSTLGQLVSTIHAVKIDRVTVLPPDSDLSARKVVGLSEEVKGTLGIDVPRLLESVVRK